MDRHEVLRRLLKAAGAAPSKEAMTEGRAVRLAVARAAEEALGLSLSVLGVTLERADLEAVCARLSGDWMLIGLWRGAEQAGIAALDLQLRAATIEMQTLGQLRAAAATARPITASDVALSGPLIEALLTQIETAAATTDLVGWTAGVRAGAMLADARAVGLALPEADYRIVEVSLDLGTAGRQGTVTLILPAAPMSVGAAAERGGRADRFAASFRATVMEAPAELHAVLHRMQLPLGRVSRFEVGQTVPLPGITVGSVRLEGPGGQVLGRARLGQVTGLRAVRLEEAAAPRLADVRLPDKGAEGRVDGRRPAKVEGPGALPGRGGADGGVGT